MSIIQGFTQYARGVADGTIPDAEIIQMLDFVEARLDASDHRLLLLIKLLYEAGDALPGALNHDIERAILGFKYDMADPGEDAMVTWTESHIVVTGVCEYLAGQRFATERFSNTQLMGGSHRERASARLRIWLADRFRFGFGEWLSGDCYATDAAALAVLIDHADDEDLRTRASMVLDLLFCDLALHRFSGRFIAASARALEPGRTQLNQSGITRIVDSTLATAPPVFDMSRVDTAFLFRTSYRVPDAVVDIAHDRKPRRVFTSQGLDLDEVSDELARHPTHPRFAPDEIGRFMWSQSAILTRESVDASCRLMIYPGMADHRALAHLARFRRVPSSLRQAALKTLDPITVGAACQRGNVFTYRAHEFTLSSAQSYHAGLWGMQQNVWTAMLGSDVLVFGNHPGSSTLGGEVGPSTPGQWVGNGINPEVGQSDNVLLALHDLRHRSGLFEGRRHLMSHIHFPVVKFDETRFGSNFVVGRRGGAYIGIVGLGALELATEFELVQRGERTGYAVVLGDISDYPSLAGFSADIKRSYLRMRGDTLKFDSPLGSYALTWGDGIRAKGRRLDSWFPRYKSQWVTTPRNPNQITVETPGHRVRLDWLAGTREVS